MQVVNKSVYMYTKTDVHKPESTKFFLCGSMYQWSTTFLHTSWSFIQGCGWIRSIDACLPAAFVADLRRVIDLHNRGGWYMRRNMPATNSGCTRHQYIVQVPANSETCAVLIYALHGLPPSGYPGGDPPVLDDTPNEPCCPHCLFGPCIIRQPLVFLTGTEER